MREDGEEISQVRGWPDDPDSARMIQTPARTIRTIEDPRATGATLKPDHPDPVPDHPDLPQQPLQSRTIRTPTRIIRTPEARFIWTNTWIIRTVPACMILGRPMYPFVPLAYINDPTSTFLGLALV